MEHKLQTDENLMRLVVNGDGDALSTLYDRYAGSVLGVVFRIIGDRAASEEVLQEIFWRVWNKSSSFDKRYGSFKTWLFSISRRMAIDEYRKRKVRPPSVTSESDLLKLETFSAETSVSGEVAASLEHAAVRNALGFLTVEQREIIQMAYFDGKTRRQIAAETQIPLGTVHTRARTALQHLRRVLISQGATET